MYPSIQGIHLVVAFLFCLVWAALAFFSAEEGKKGAFTLFVALAIFTFALFITGGIDLISKANRMTDNVSRETGKQD